MPNRPVDDCFFTDQDRLTHREALELIGARVAPVGTIEQVALLEALGRIAATTVAARRPVPGHANAAVDGYAFSSRDYDPAAGNRLPVTGRAAAGAPLAGDLSPGSAVRIFTGAVIPDGLDTVAMQEDVRIEQAGAAAFAWLPAGLETGANRRRAGEDLAAGDPIVSAGQRLRPQEIAGLASAGVADLACWTRLRVALVSSGDEVVPAGQELAPGQVHDANAPMLEALVRTTGARPRPIGILRDDRALVRKALAETAAASDLIISSGGASQGEEDHIAAALAEIGHRHLWQIAVKPGRPMFFGQIGRCLYLGLPGNPVAVFVCFLLYARPLIRRLGGESPTEPVRFRVRAGFELASKKPGRREFWRAMLRIEPDGPVALKYPRDGSGLITSLRASDGLIEVAEDVTAIRPGDLVDFIPYSEFGI